MQRACGIVVAASVAAVLATAGPASAGIVQLPPPFGCLSAIDDRCLPVHDGAIAGDFVLSPDGRNAYTFAPRAQGHDPLPAARLEQAPHALLKKLRKSCPVFLK